MYVNMYCKIMYFINSSYNYGDTYSYSYGYVDG